MDFIKIPSTTSKGEAPLLNEKMALVEGIPFYYKVVGNGPPLLLLHGMNTNHSCWRKVWSEYSKSYTVYVMDLPGFGKNEYSPSQPKNYVTYFNKVLIRVFNKHSKLDVIASSFAGYIVVEGALKGVDINNVILLNPSLFTQKCIFKKLYYKSPHWLKIPFIIPLIHYWTLRHVFQGPVKWKECLWAFNYAKNDQGYKTSHKTLKWIDKDYKNQIPKNYVTIYTENDHIIKAKYGQTLVNRGQLNNFHILQEGGHHPMESHPSIFTKKTKELLQSLG